MAAPGIFKLFHVKHWRNMKFSEMIKNIENAGGLEAGRADPG
jgi:hypothetical protein